MVKLFLCSSGDGTKVQFIIDEYEPIIKWDTFAELHLLTRMSLDWL